MSSVEFRVIQVDRQGYRVYPREGDPWDKDLADAVLLVARASYAFAKTKRLPRVSVKLDWPGGTAVVALTKEGVQAVIVEEKQETPQAPGAAKGFALT